MTEAIFSTQPPGEIMMEQTTSVDLFGDILKLLAQYKLPGIDVAAIIEMRRKDIDALMTANRVALEGAQSVGQKQVEILRSTLDQLSSLIRQASASESMTERTTKTRELVQQVLQRALENMRELAETAHKSQTDTYAVLTKRIQENLDEAKALLRPEK
jgi:phasin family protein